MRFLSALLVLVLGGCGGSQEPASATRCGGNERPQLDCSPTVAFDSTKVNGGFEAFGIGATVNTEKTALRQIDDATQSYVLQFVNLCKEYNACAISQEDYSTRSENLRRRLAKVPELYESLGAAKGDNEKTVAALASAYSQLVPEDQRVELELDFSVQGQGAAESAPHALRSGERLPTGSRLFFTLRLSKPAYVYLFQKTALGETNVIFPDPRMALKNPIPATPVRIPDGTGAFRVNDRDIGTERVFVVASLTPVSSLDTAIAKLGNSPPSVGALKDVTGTTDSKDCKTRALELDQGSGQPGCTRSRGLDLDPGDASSMRARTEAADSTIVQVFSFEHTRQ
jgi:hypothetical protein